MGGENFYVIYSVKNCVRGNVKILSIKTLIQMLDYKKQKSFGKCKKIFTTEFRSLIEIGNTID